MVRGEDAPHSITVKIYRGCICAMSNIAYSQCGRVIARRPKGRRSNLISSYFNKEKNETRFMLKKLGHCHKSCKRSIKNAAISRKKIGAGRGTADE